MKPTLRSAVESALQALGIDSATLPDFMVEVPKEPSHGDLATNVALVSSKALGKPPREIAASLKEILEARTDVFREIGIAGPGFLNVRFQDRFLQEKLEEAWSKGDSLGRTSGNKGKRILIEFVSANPTGPLTVGHGRNAVLGDTIARLFEWTGAHVDREYYFNNAGRQMRVLGQSVRARYDELCGRPCDFPEGGYEGSYITDIARELLDEEGPGLTGDDPATEKRFRQKAEQVIFKDILATLERLGIRMDSFFNENTLYENDAIGDVIRRLREKDLVYDADGAVWFRTSALGKEKDTVLVKSTGEPTYRLPDIAYHMEKLSRGYDTCIDVFGADHIDTYPDVVRGVESLGGRADRIDVLVYQFVTLIRDGKPFKMSTRKANFVTLDELMDEVGRDVTRFFFLMRSPSTHLEFDLDQARETGEKNPVFYLQYAHARIRSILRKAEDEMDSERTDWSTLSHPAELALIRAILGFPDAIVTAAVAKEPQKLINYLQDLASGFTTFYHDCRIMGEDGPLLTARARLAETTVRVLANGLAILGITAPERM